MKFNLVCTSLLILVGITNPAIAKGEKTMVVEKGRKVSFDYTLTVDGEIVDSSKDKGPFEYTYGEGKIIPGLAEGMKGMHIGEEKTITVPPQEAYGQINPQAFKEIPKSSLPKDVEPKVGMVLGVHTPDGNTIPVRIAEVKKDNVVLDFNHPLAGKTLEFKVKVISIK